MQLALASSGKRSLLLSIPQIEAPAIIQEYLVQAEAHDNFFDDFPDCDSDEDGLPCLRAGRVGLRKAKSTLMGFGRVVVMIEEPIQEEGPI